MCYEPMKNFDNQLASQSSILVMVPKTHSPGKCKLILFDEYKLLDKEIDRLTDIIK